MLHGVLGGVDASQPVLWPEHFDVGVTLDEVNYGVSPGDDFVGVPYAYVGAHAPEKHRGEFWNAPFGAARELSMFEGVDDVLAFFMQGRALT